MKHSYYLVICLCQEVSLQLQIPLKLKRLSLSTWLLHTVVGDVPRHSSRSYSDFISFSPPSQLDNLEACESM